MGEKTRYLYGASVQGIQDFIFKINKLKEVVGASRIVEEVCTSKFAEKLGKTILEMKQDKNAIVNAAGNIKYIFDDYDSCQKIVRDFPKTVATMAPGITISQAVVEMAGDFVNFSEAVDEIERRLHIQRNKPMNHTSPRLMGIARSKETHLPAVKKMDKRLYDAASVQRMERTNNSNIVRSNTIIHADGNAMGSLFSRLGSDKEYLKKFSAGLDELVKKCVETAINTTIEADRQNILDNTVYINCIICSGDDVTVMCDSKYALPFIQNYLYLLENHSKFLLKDTFGDNPPFSCITACAGIAFLGQKTTFREGYRIANYLCDLAKNDSFQHRNGNMLPSCALFYKQTGSVVGNLESSYYQTMHPAKGHSFLFGPYYLNDTKNRWTIRRFLNFCSESKHEVGLRKYLIDWIDWMYEDIDRSELYRKHTIGSQGITYFSMSTSPVIRDNASYYLGYDLMTYLAILLDKK